MSSLLEGLMGQLGGSVLGQLGQQAGVSENQVGSVVQSVLPALLGGLSRNAQSGTGANALMGALDRDHDGSVLDDLAGFLGSGNAQSDGQKILGHVFGGREQKLQQNLGQQAGMSSEAVGKVMAMLAPVVMGALGREKRQQGLDVSTLAGMLGQQTQQIEKQQPAVMGLLSGLMDADGDGDVDASDIARKGVGLLGRLFGRR